jgi:beta-lactam-binding protein with PASTA domain
VRVPDVHGLQLGAAVAVLTSLGLQVEGQSLRARPDAYTRCTVLSQGVSAGSQVGVGETVPLVLSAGPHLQTVGGLRLVFVGGTCELMPTVTPCVGGLLFVPLEHG